MSGVRDFISVKRLNNTRNLKELENGIGCRYEDENGTSAFENAVALEFSEQRFNAADVHKIS